MPLLDLSFLTAEPLLADTFTVQRRAATIDQNGRANISAPQTFAGIMGGVSPTTPSDIARLPEDQRMAKTIRVITQFALQGALFGGGIPDQVAWNGDTYVVLNVQDYSQYGAGFFDAICGITTPEPSVA